MRRGYSCIGLHRPKNHLNVGATLRAAGVYESAFVACSGDRIPFKFHRAPTDTMRAYRHMPLFRVSDLRDVIPYDCVPVAIDIIEGARLLQNYVHPERAFYIFGPEDGTLGKSVTDWCRDVVYIPTKRCMNLAATVNVVLYDRLAKEAK